MAPAVNIHNHKHHANVTVIIVDSQTEEEVVHHQLPPGQSRMFPYDFRDVFCCDADCDEIKGLQYHVNRDHEYHQISNCGDYQMEIRKSIHQAA